MGELYGEINKLTMEWRDGLMAITVRVCVQVGAPEQYGFRSKLLFLTLNTVEPRLTTTPFIRPPRYYGHILSNQT